MPTAPKLGKGERAKVAVINADAAVAAELLGPVAHMDPSTDAANADAERVEDVSLDGGWNGRRGPMERGSPS
jgi:hypothetical protein